MHYLKLLFILLLSFFVFPHAMSGQTKLDGNSSSSNVSSPNFNIDVSNPLSQPFYIDTYGLELLKQNISGTSHIDVKNYILGSGDLLTLELSGNISTLMRGLSINATGDLVIPSIGVVSIERSKIPAAQEIIQKVIDDKLQDTRAHLSLDQPRSVVAHINGQIPQPGSYQIPAFTRIDRAVIPALTGQDGQSNGNSISSERPASGNQNQLLTRLNKLEDRDYALRNITIIHSDASRDTADLISYYRTGNVDHNPYVQDGDIIKLHKLNANSPRISISGAIRNVEKFSRIRGSSVDSSRKNSSAISSGNIPRQKLEVEYKAGDTIADLIEMAGGVRTDADPSFVFLFRVEEGDIEKVRVDRKDFTTVKLSPYDRIVVPYHRQRKMSYSASVFGEISYPGQYPIQENKTSVYDLIQMAEGLTDEALPQGAFLIRNINDDQINSEEIREERLKRSSDQVLEGFQYLEMESKLSEGRVYINLNDSEQLKGVKLFDGDQLFIPRNDNTVFVFGQVQNPGYYPFVESTNTSTEAYIERAGGMSIAANMERVFVIKAGNKAWIPAEKATVESGDMIFVDRIPFENIAEKRQFELRTKQVKNSNTSLILSGVATVASVITTIFAITTN